MYHFLKIGCEAESISCLWERLWFRMYLLLCFSFKAREEVSGLSRREPRKKVVESEPEEV